MNAAEVHRPRLLFVCLYSARLQCMLLFPRCFWRDQKQCGCSIFIITSFVFVRCLLLNTPPTPPILRKLAPKTASFSSQTRKIYIDRARNYNVVYLKKSVYMKMWEPTNVTLLEILNYLLLCGITVGLRIGRN